MEYIKDSNHEANKANKANITNTEERKRKKKNYQQFSPPPLDIQAIRMQLINNTNKKIPTTPFPTPKQETSPTP
jgi:hypothetical protein